jgi:hypothetical protein
VFRHSEPVVADRGDRFRRLRRPETGDLFAHFGIELEPALPAIEPAIEPRPHEPLDAVGCRTCSWYLPYRRDTPTCPVCGDPEPLLTAAST